MDTLIVFHPSIPDLFELQTTVKNGVYQIVTDDLFVILDEIDSSGLQVSHIGWVYPYHGHYFPFQNIGEFDPFIYPSSQFQYFGEGFINFAETIGSGVKHDLITSNLGMSWFPSVVTTLENVLESQLSTEIDIGYSSSLVGNDPLNSSWIIQRDSSDIDLRDIYFDSSALDTTSWTYVLDDGIRGNQILALQDIDTNEALFSSTTHGDGTITYSLTKDIIWGPNTISMGATPIRSQQFIELFPNEHLDGSGFQIKIESSNVGLFDGWCNATDTSDMVMDASFHSHVSHLSLDFTPNPRFITWGNGGLFCRGQVFLSVYHCSVRGICETFYSGGLIGQEAGSHNGQVLLEDCETKCLFYNSYFVGGMVGFNSGTENGSLLLRRCYGTPSFDFGSSFSGLLVGPYCAFSNGTVNINDCWTRGDIDGLVNSGIVAAFSSHFNGTLQIERCFTRGDIKGDGCSGISGGYSGGSTIFRSCFTLGSISGNSTSGIIGSLATISSSSSCLLEDCYSIGDITGLDSGGLVGFTPSVNNGALTIRRCYVNGSISDAFSGSIHGPYGSTFPPEVGEISFTQFDYISSSFDSSSGLITINQNIDNNPTTSTINIEGGFLFGASRFSYNIENEAIDVSSFYNPLNQSDQLTQFSEWISSSIPQRPILFSFQQSPWTPTSYVYPFSFPKWVEQEQSISSLQDILTQPQSEITTYTLPSGTFSYTFQGNPISLHRPFRALSTLEGSSQYLLPSTSLGEPDILNIDVPIEQDRHVIGFESLVQTTQNVSKARFHLNTLVQRPIPYPYPTDTFDTSGAVLHIVSDETELRDALGGGIVNGKTVQDGDIVELDASTTSFSMTQQIHVTVNVLLRGSTSLQSQTQTITSTANTMINVQSPFIIRDIILHNINNSGQCIDFKNTTRGKARVERCTFQCKNIAIRTECCRILVDECTFEPAGTPKIHSYIAFNDFRTQSFIRSCHFKGNSDGTSNGIRFNSPSLQSTFVPFSVSLSNCTGDTNSPLRAFVLFNESFFGTSQFELECVNSSLTTTEAFIDYKTDNPNLRGIRQLILLNNTETSSLPSELHRGLLSFRSSNFTGGSLIDLPPIIAFGNQITSIDPQYLDAGDVPGIITYDSSDIIYDGPLHPIRQTTDIQMNLLLSNITNSSLNLNRYSDTGIYQSSQLVTRQATSTILGKTYGVYPFSLSRNSIYDLAVAGNIGGDPHIITLHGTHIMIPPTKHRQWDTLFETEDFHIVYKTRLIRSLELRKMKRYHANGRITPIPKQSYHGKSHESHRYHYLDEIKIIHKPSRRYMRINMDQLKLQYSNGMRHIPHCKKRIQNGNLTQVNGSLSYPRKLYKGIQYHLHGTKYTLQLSLESDIYWEERHNIGLMVFGEPKIKRGWFMKKNITK